MSIYKNIEYGIIGIIIILITIFTDVISVGNTGIIIQEPNINFLPVFLNSGFFLTVIFLLFLILMPYIILKDNSGKKRR